MHRALSISERVSKMMTGHVAFGKPAAPCHLGLVRTALCALPLLPKTNCHSQLATDLQLSKLKQVKNKYTLDKNNFRDVIISSFSFVDAER